MSNNSPAEEEAKRGSVNGTSHGQPVKQASSKKLPSQEPEEPSRVAKANRRDPRVERTVDNAVSGQKKDIGRSSSNVHVIVTLVSIILDLVLLIERFGNLIGDYLPTWALQLAPLVPLLPFSYLFWKVNVADGGIRYRPIWRNLTSVLLGLAIVVAILVIIPREPVSSKLPVLIADIDDHTGDQLFSGIGARALLARVLKQSPSIAVFQEERLGDVLRRMKRLPQTRITNDVGREICYREGVGPLVSWSAVESEDRYTLEARILDPQTGKILSQVRTDTFARDAVIAAVDDLGKQLLKKSFGNSSLKIYELTKPLARATTKSLPALQAYSEALPKLYELDYDAAKPRLLKALEIDPDFALAMVELASLYEYKQDTQSAIGYLKKAFELRDSLTEPERVRVSEYYYWLVKNDHAQATNEVSEFLKNYPRNQERLGTLAYENFTLMNFDIAKEQNQKLLGPTPWRRSSAEDAVALWNTQLSSDEFKQTLETAREIQHDMPDLTDNPYLFVIPNLALGEIPAAENEISSLKRAENTEASLWLGGILNLYRGKLQAASEEWDRYIPLISPQEGSKTPWMDNKGKAHLWAARVAWLRDRPQEARRHLEQVSDVREELLAEAAKYYARLGDLNEAQELLKRLRARLAERTTNQNRLLLQLLEGEIELKNGHSEASFNLMSQAPNYSWSYLYWQAEESRVHIALETGHPEDAVKACNEMLGKKGFAFSSDRPDDWVMAHYYLGQAYDKLNKKDRALNSYIEFESFWHDGDVELRALVTARKRIAELKR